MRISLLTRIAFVCSSPRPPRWRICELACAKQHRNPLGCHLVECAVRMHGFASPTLFLRASPSLHCTRFPLQVDSTGALNYANLWINQITIEVARSVFFLICFFVCASWQRRICAYEAQEEATLYWARQEAQLYWDSSQSTLPENCIIGEDE